MFTFLVLFAAFLIESIGTYVSVVGLSSLFSSNPVIILLAVSLDIGKVVTVSFLYRNWKDISWVMKSYMTVAAFVLMLITSVGAFGYLSAEFQKAIQGTNENAVVIQAMEDEQERLQSRKEQIDDQIAKFPPEFVTGRRQATEQFAPEVSRINGRLAEIDKELPQLKLETIKQNVEVGPIIFIAEAFGVTPEKAVKYVILIIIFVFDPLAVALLIAGNFLIKNKELLKIKRQQEELEAKKALDAIVGEQPIFVAPVTAVQNAISHPPTIEPIIDVATKLKTPAAAQPIDNLDDAIVFASDKQSEIEPRIETGGITAEMDDDNISDLDIYTASEDAQEAIQQIADNQTRPHLRSEKLLDDREIITKDQLITKKARSQLEDAHSNADVFEDDVRPCDSKIKNEYRD